MGPGHQPLTSSSPNPLPYPGHTRIASAIPAVRRDASLRPSASNRLSSSHCPRRQLELATPMAHTLPPINLRPLVAAAAAPRCPGRTAYRQACPDRSSPPTRLCMRAPWSPSLSTLPRARRLGMPPASTAAACHLRDVRYRCSISPVRSDIRKPTIACRPIFTGGVPQEKKTVAAA
jgi:hypothetical protein